MFLPFPRPLAALLCAAAHVAALGEANRALQVKFDFATSDSLRKMLDCGVEVLHFAGHAGIDPSDYIGG
jgi:hypothetical protein